MLRKLPVHCMWLAAIFSQIDSFLVPLTKNVDCCETKRVYNSLDFVGQWFWWTTSTISPVAISLGSLRAWWAPLLFCVEHIQATIRDEIDCSYPSFSLAVHVSIGDHLSFEINRKYHRPFDWGVRKQLWLQINGNNSHSNRIKRTRSYRLLSNTSF